MGDERDNGVEPRCSSSTLPQVETPEQLAYLLKALAGEGYRVDANITVHSQSWHYGAVPPGVLLELMIKQLCDDPHQVRVESHITKRKAVFDVYVSERDFPKVVGAGASYAYAMRTLFGAIFRRLGKRLHLLVVDPRRGKKK